MTFAQTIDPRWHHRRHSGSRRIGKRGFPPHPSHVYYHDHHADANVARVLTFSDGIATFSHPTAGVVVEEKKRPSRMDRRGVVPLPLRRVERGTFGRLDDLKVGSSSSSSCSTDSSSAADVSGVVGQPQDGGVSDWSREGLLGYGARVLALSMYSDKREPLCDRKDPYLHLTPRRLAFTVVKSGFVVAAPIINQVILENLDEDDDHPPPRRASEGGAGGGGGGGGSGMGAYSAALGGLGTGSLGVYYDTDGRLVFDREEADEDVGDEGEDVMKSLSKSFEIFPALTFRRVLHSVMTVSTQRLLEWQAVMNLSARTADRLTKNIALSALRKTKRMSRGVAAAKMTLTAGKSLFFQNLALFIVDELFLAVRLGLRERRRRKQNPYSCTDWAAVLREMREKSLCNASFAFCIWMAGTLGTVAGTIVYPARGPELLSILAEMGASALLT